MNKTIVILCLLMLTNLVTGVVFANEKSSTNPVYEQAKQAVKVGKSTVKVGKNSTAAKETTPADTAKEAERIRREIAARSEKPEVYLARGKVFDELKEYRNAIANYDFAIYLNPKLWQAYYQRALDRSILGENEQALDDLNQVLNLRPKYAEAYYRRGQVLINMGEYIPAILEFEKVDDSSASLKAKAAQGTGIANYRLKQAAVATKNFEMAANLDPLDADNYVWLGRLKADSRDYNAALALYDKAIAIEPSISVAYLFKGRTLAFFMKKYDEGIAAFTKAIELEPNNADSYLQRAYAYNQKGNGNMAKADFDKAITLNPNLKDQVLPAYLGDAKQIPQVKPAEPKRIVVTAGQ